MNVVSTRWMKHHHSALLVISGRWKPILIHLEDVNSGSRVLYMGDITVIILDLIRLLDFILLMNFMLFFFNIIIELPFGYRKEMNFMSIFLSLNNYDLKCVHVMPYVGM